MDESSSDLQILCHQREWLFLAILSISQRLDSVRISGVAGEVVAAESFDREDFARLQHFSGTADARFVSANCFVAGACR